MSVALRVEIVPDQRTLHAAAMAGKAAKTLKKSKGDLIGAPHANTGAMISSYSNIFNYHAGAAFCLANHKHIIKYIREIYILLYASTRLPLHTIPFKQ